MTVLDEIAAAYDSSYKDGKQSHGLNDKERAVIRAALLWEADTKPRSPIEKRLAVRVVLLRESLKRKKGGK